MCICSSISDKELADICNAVVDLLGSLDQCIKLAGKLQVRDSDMNKLQFCQQPRYETAAREVLNSWRCAWKSSLSQAYKVLFAALDEIGRHDVMRSVNSLR